MRESDRLESAMRPPQQRLFFALRPPPEAAAAIQFAADQLRAAGAISGKWLKPSKYHITLRFLGTHAGVPPELVAASERAASGVSGSVLEVVLDRAASFQRSRQAPCILLAAPDAQAVLGEFGSELGAALAAQGIRGQDDRNYTPHLTIAYGALATHAPVAIAPIAWHAREFALLLSHVGSGVHEVLRSWPLNAAP
jgi:2'-5' RNA ligase